MKAISRTVLPPVLFGLSVCLLILPGSCTNSPAYATWVVSAADSLAATQMISRAIHQVDSLKRTIRTGDLILRTGNDFTSEGLRSLNRRDQTYSHCGIASLENDSLFVYHSLGGEWNPDQRIRRDPIGVFGEPYGNRGIGVYRFSLSSEDLHNVMTTVKRLYVMGIMFDMKFNLASNDRMYCAEFVYKSFLMGTRGKLQFRTSHIGNFEFIGVDDLFLQPLCHEKSRIRFQ
jgi:hypothetical protein